MSAPSLPSTSVEADGHHQIIALSNSSETFTFTQLGGLHFRGPTSGVLPNGPNGITAFNTLDLGPREDYSTAITYNYSLALQGFVSNVSCQYDTTDASSPVKSAVDPATLLDEFEGTCPQGQETVSGLTLYTTPVGYVGNLGAWACNTDEESYTVYLRGEGNGTRDNYVQTVGNMTCVISSIRHTIYDVDYNGQNNVFSVQTEGPTTTPIPSLYDPAVVSVVNTMAEAQGLSLNQVAESVITFGVKNFGIQQSSIYSPNAIYPQLYEAMIQGILQYEVRVCAFVGP
jgi:hypothetical protein